jgi:hypothetical protein
MKSALWVAGIGAVLLLFTLAMIGFTGIVANI